MPPKITLEQARAAKATAKSTFAKLGNVTGIGITKIGAHYALKINLASAPADATFPTNIDGVPIRLEITGPIRPH